MNSRAIPYAIIGLIWIQSLGGCASFSTPSASFENTNSLDERTEPSIDIDGLEEQPNETLLNPLSEEQPPSSSSEEVYGPEAKAVQPVTLILGPGMARGYAHAGVLKALEEGHVSIGAIFGTEMGALMGVLYGVSQNLNEFEWMLLKLKGFSFYQEVTPSLLSLFKGPAAWLSRFSQALQPLLAHKDLKQTRIPVFVGILNERTQLAEYRQEGDALATVLASLALPGLMEGSSIGGEKYTSLATVEPLSIRRALSEQTKSTRRVYVVNVIPPKAQLDSDSKMTRGFEKTAVELFKKIGPLATEAEREAEMVIKPEIKGMKLWDYQRRTDAVFSGKQKVQKVIGSNG